MAGCTPMAQHGQGTAATAHRHAAAGPATSPVQQTPALDLREALDLEGIIPKLADKRVVFIGERHDRYEHHLVQLEIIRRLHAIHPRLAIGMEMFQQPFQDVLDDYIAGTLSEQEMLRRSEYYQRWRFDFRLYAPILRYARANQLPVIALNLPAELTQKVGRNGLDGLTVEEQAQLPAEIDRSDSAYAQQLRDVFAQHPGNDRSFDNFLEVQLLWDEGMAQQAADYLASHPDYYMVILAGSGHIARGSGIPRRLARRLPASSAIVLNGWEGALEPGLADFILLPEPRALPPSGRFGLLLETQNPVPVVEACIPDSPCTRAGLQQGDRFLSIDGAPIEDITDLRLAMWDKLPGDTVTLEVSRKRWFSAPQVLSYSIELR
ncbi:MAG: ChaN family lipoprotein [Gammaproteobacteria bacterium]